MATAPVPTANILPLGGSTLGVVRNRCTRREARPEPRAAGLANCPLTRADRFDLLEPALLTRYVTPADGSRAKLIGARRNARSSVRTCAVHIGRRFMIVTPLSLDDRRVIDVRE
jgi:hypothetical protein